ncbi:hypothetical protein [Loktanella sp. Alg231-35]|uniref:hypothetical protein n=1 Tax=Loktanella sp. Alg231-35 TaxID=1922220 RepID=UPI00131F3932|nr:hypothetical protein [Loktanella sp. Alg231-35]
MTAQLPPTMHDKTATARLIAGAKWAFTTRRVDRDDLAGLSKNYKDAVAGDLVLCQILEIGHHRRIQLADRRGSITYPGDLVVVCLGDRYAPDQFLCRAEITDAPIELAAGGGIVGVVEAAHMRMDDPTKLLPIGLLKNATDQVMNVADYALPKLPKNNDVTVIGVFGASMNSGKTTAAVSLAHGLQRAGFDVAGIKATGTGAFGDFNAFDDAGVPVTDFTDAGMATTFKMPLERIEEGFDTLVATAAANGANMVVVEIADGVFQQETRAILEGSRIKNRLDGILFAAPDALSAMGGVMVLERYGLRPFAISGKVSCSPLGAKEAADVSGLPIVTREELWDQTVVTELTAAHLRQSNMRGAA